MAVVGTVGCGRNIRLQRYDSSCVFNFQCRRVAPLCSLMVSNPQLSKPKTSKILAAASFSEGGLRSLPKQAERKHKEFPYEKTNDWLRHSVAEIVKKLPESPLLVHVYSDDDSKTNRTRTEKAEEDNWVSMKQKWKKGEIPMPDGVILWNKYEEEERRVGRIRLPGHGALWFREKGTTVGRRLVTC